MRLARAIACIRMRVRDPPAGPRAGRTEAIAEALQHSLSGAQDQAGHSPVSASIGFGLARSGAMISFASIEADRGVYHVKSRKDGRRR